MIINNKLETEIPELCKKILALATKDGTVDEQDLDRRLGMLVTDKLLDTINFEPQPPKPDALLEYNKLSRDRRFVFDKENSDWRRKPTIEDWMNKSSAAITSNSSNVYWLQYWRKSVDPARSEKIRAKLVEFQVHTTPTVTVARPEPEPNVPTEVKAVLDLFNGTIVRRTR